MRYFSLLMFVCTALLAVPALAAQGVPGSADQTMLSPGDTVRIVVSRQPEYTGDFVIAPDGSITHPLLRDVKIAGVPLATAEARLRDYLAKEVVQNPRFVMEPLLRVSVSGRVPRPMVFVAQPETSISAAIARAGGVSEDGDRQRVRIIRTERSGSQRTFQVNLEDPADRLALTPIRSGDQIVVDRRRSFFRDLFIPAISVIGSVASLGLLVDRMSRD